jgi:hypothetical protein
MATPVPAAHRRQINLDTTDRRAMDVLAERVVGLASTDLVLAELDVTETKLARWLGDAQNRAAVNRHLLELKKSGELGRWLANSSLVDNVGIANQIAADEELHPNTRIKAVDSVTRVATTAGNQPRPETNAPRGPSFSLTLNFGGGQEAKISGETIEQDANQD